MKYKTYKETMAEIAKKEKQETVKGNLLGFIVTVVVIGLFFICTSL